jgi:hypothetical protein
VQGSGQNWTSVTTIEGNSNDQVSRSTYHKGNSILAGFGRPKWSVVTDGSIPDPAPTPTPTPTPTGTIQVGDKVKVKSGAKYYNTNITVPQFVLNDTWIVLSISGNRVVINKNVSGSM